MNSDNAHLLGSRGLIVLLGLLTAIGPLSIDMYLPGMPALRDELHTTDAQAQISLSTFFVGLAAGQLLLGPLSDRFGRRGVLLFGAVLYIAASLACLLAPAIDTLVASRLVQGLGAAAGPVVSRAVIRDVYHGREAARAQSFVILVMAIAPLVAPFIGGYVVKYFGWRAIFAVLTAFGFVALGLIVLILSETHPPVRRLSITLTSRFAAFATVLRRPQALAYLMCGALAFASLFAYITGAPFVLIERFGIAPEHFGYFFAANVLGMMVGNYLNGRLVVQYGPSCMLLVGTIVTTGASAGMVLAWTAGQLSLAMLLALIFCATSVIGLVGGNTIALLLDLFPASAGAASALFGVFQFGLGAAAAAAVGWLPLDTTGAMVAVMGLSGAGALIARLLAGAPAGEAA